MDIWGIPQDTPLICAGWYMTRKLILNVRCAWLLAGMGIRTNRLAGFCCIDQAGLVGFWLWLWAVWLWLLAPGKQRPCLLSRGLPPASGSLLVHSDVTSG